VGSENPSNGKKVWLEILNSSGMTALITTLLGGLFVSFITARYQEKAKEVERSRAEVSDYLERERKVVEDAFAITGRLLAASENMIELTSDAFDERGRGSSDLGQLRRRKQEIVNRYNDADREWRAQKTTLGLRIKMEHGADQLVSDAWQKAAASATEFSDCSRLWFETHSDPVDQSKLELACANRRRSLEESLDSLTKEILRTRHTLSRNSSR
jgi:hypothetical protein